jgi:hypothetical protein
MSAMNVVSGAEYVQAIEQPFMTIVSQIIDEFDELFEEAAASGNKMQLQEVMNYMNEEAQRQLNEYTGPLGFRVEFTFNFNGKTSLNDGLKYIFRLYDEGPPEGRLQA